MAPLAAAVDLEGKQVVVLMVVGAQAVAENMAVVMGVAVEAMVAMVVTLNMRHTRQDAGWLRSCTLAALNTQEPASHR